MSSNLMSIGLRSMFASSAAINTTAHNIANADVAGYSRQEVMLETTAGQRTGAGFFGKGVDVVNVRRAHNDFLTMQQVVARSLAAADRTRADHLAQLEAVFPPGETGLGWAMGEFFTAMSNLAANPADSSARQVVLARAADTADLFAAAGAQVDLLQQGVRQDAQTHAETINALAQRIATLNDQIAKVDGSRYTPNDLLDQREQAVLELGELVQVNTLPADDGSLGVFIAGGAPLVLGTAVNPVAVGDSDTDPAQCALYMQMGSQRMLLPADTLGSGAVPALLRYQGEDITAARNSLGQMAAAFAGELNRAQSLGLDLSNPPIAGAPLFGFTATVAGVPAAHNARNAAGPLTSASTTITDPALLQASDYELALDTSGSGKTYAITRLSDGAVLYADSGDVIDGFAVTVAGAPLQAGERILLKPVSLAASSLHRTLDDPQGLAAALPVTATLGVANTGTASVASLTMTGQPHNPNWAVSLTFNDNLGNYTLTTTDTTTNTVVGSSTGTWVAGTAITANGFALQLNGAPQAGDTLAVDRTQFPAGNNGNALAMAGMGSAALVGRTLNGLGQPSGGASLTDAYAAAMAQIGVRSQAAQTAARISDAAAQNADGQVASASGVNLDEEAARLIHFQQSYQAAAKVLQTAQTMFDTLLQVAG